MSSHLFEGERPLRLGAAGIGEAARERRRAARQRKLIRAAAFQAGPVRRFACIIRDISDSGCRLVGAHIDLVHSRFVLSIDGDTQGPRRCEVVWRRYRMIGVRFLGPASDPHLS